MCRCPGPPLWGHKESRNPGIVPFGSSRAPTAWAPQAGAACTARLGHQPGTGQCTETVMELGEMNLRMGP